MVYKGELIYVDWLSLLDTNVRGVLSYSNGEAMVHTPRSLPFNPFTSFGQGLLSLGFYPLNYW